MSDTDVDAYRKSLTKPIGEWMTELAALQKKLAPLDAEIKKLNDIKSPGPDDKKKLAALSKQRDALRAKIDTAHVELGRALVALPPAIKADDKDLIKLPPYVEKLIKDKGAIPLGDGVSIKPDVSFDVKKKKITKVGVTLIWRF